MTNDSIRRLLRAGSLTAVVDGIFASVLSVAAYGSTATRLWQGVAATVLGPAAFEGGTRTAAVGVLMHIGVAFWWSAVFLAVTLWSARVRRLLASWAGVVAVALVYGPFIWIVMSFVVIPFLLNRPPAITFRWWVQLLGHIPFVAVPIALGIHNKRSRDHEDNKRSGEQEAKRAGDQDTKSAGDQETKRAG
jgi:hypothetical protein